MTGREKIQALIRRLRDDSERFTTLAEELINKALESVETAEALDIIAKKMDDETCEKATADWNDMASN